MEGSATRGVKAVTSGESRVIMVLMFFEYFEMFYMRQQFGVTYIITELLFSLAIAAIFNYFEKSWKFVLRLLVDWACVFACMLFFSCLEQWIYSLCVNDTNAFSPYSRYFKWLAVSLIHTAYPRRAKLRHRLVMAAIASTLVVLGISFSGSLGSFITSSVGIYPTSENIGTDWTAYIVFAFTALLVAFLKIWPIAKFRFIKLDAMIILNVLLFTSYIGYCLFEILKPGDGAAGISILMPLLFYVIDSLAYGIFYISCRNYNQVIETQATAIKSESEAKQLAISDSKYEELHRIKHDIENHFGVVAALLKEEHYDELKEYFADLYEQSRIAVDYVECGNVIISSVLNMELSRAYSLGIKIEHHIVVPKTLTIADADLVSLLSNLIDNAIEAEERDGRKDCPIVVSLRQEGAYLLIEVENAIAAGNERRVLSLHSRKQNRLHHGYGSKIVKSIVTQNGGTIKYEAKDGVFKVTAMILNAEQ